MVRHARGIDCRAHGNYVWACSKSLIAKKKRQIEATHNVTNPRTNSCREWLWAEFYFYSLFFVSFNSSKSHRKMVWTIMTICQWSIKALWTLKSFQLKIHYQNHRKIYSLLEIQQWNYNWTAVHISFGSNLLCKKKIENITGALTSSSVIKWVIAINSDALSFMINFMNKDRKQFLLVGSCLREIRIWVSSPLESPHDPSHEYRGL